MARRAGAVTIETASERACKKGYRSSTGRMCLSCPVPGPASCGHLALQRSLQEEVLELEVIESRRRRKISPGIVLSKMKPKNPPMNMCVVKSTTITWSSSLTPSNREDNVLVFVVSVNIWRTARAVFASHCHETSGGIRKRNNLNQQQRQTWSLIESHWNNRLIVSLSPQLHVWKCWRMT